MTTTDENVEVERVSMRDNLGVQGVTRQAFEGFFCTCGYDAFIELTRRSVDNGMAVAGAFGSNQRIMCACCRRMWTFRGGKWVEVRLEYAGPVFNTPQTREPSAGTKPAPRRAAMSRPDTGRRRR